MKTAPRPHPAYHHFNLSPEVVLATSYEETMETLVAMEEFDLCHLPYKECVVSIRAASIVNSEGWFNQIGPDCSDDVTLYMLVLDKMIWGPNPLLNNPDYKEKYRPPRIPGFMVDHLIVLVYDNGVSVTMDVADLSVRHSHWAHLSESDYLDFVSTIRDLGSFTAMILITALSAKNIEKQTAINKRAHRGVGNGKFRGPGDKDVIYLSTTKLALPASVLSGGGTMKKPHLRRGHPHWYRYGPGRTEMRRIFVHPIYVNRDKAFGPINPKTYKVTT